MASKEDRKKRCAPLLKPSSRVFQLNVSAMTSLGVLGCHSRKSLSPGGGSKVLERRHAAQVFDEGDQEVTPLSLLPAEAKTHRFFVDEISAESTSEQTSATASFTMPFSRSVLGSSRISSQSTIESMNEEIEETFSKRDTSLNFPDVQRRREAVKEQISQKTFQEALDVFLRETQVSLLDVRSGLLSLEAEDTERVLERSATGSHPQLLHRAVQTLNGGTKNKQVQSGSGSSSSSSSSAHAGQPHQEEGLGKSGAGGQPQEARLKKPDSGGSAVREQEVVNAEADLQEILHSERFQHSLLQMERSILGNVLQLKLAAYKQLPERADPNAPKKPQTDTCPSPAVEKLWAFDCELSRGRAVTCMAWNKSNPDLLAVSYGESELSDGPPGLLCCWSLKNPRWPQRLLRCQDVVTALDFSANNPSQLALGRRDGIISIYDVQSPDASPVISSCDSPRRHLGPVWQLSWNQQDSSWRGGQKVEALLSVAADGRVSKWFVCNNGLDCIDVMRLKRLRRRRRSEGGGVQREAAGLLSALTPALCFHFHPSDPSIYLVGTGEGLLHRCSLSNSQQLLETYKTHFCAVSRVWWSPLREGLFLSCSCDWSMQLWSQERAAAPLLSFSSTQSGVRDISWSPQRPALFAAIHEEQLEIWHLDSNSLEPVMVEAAVPGQGMESLLFAPRGDCVLVGDSGGQVTVFQLKGLCSARDTPLPLAPTAASGDRRHL